MCSWITDERKRIITEQLELLRNAIENMRLTASQQEQDRISPSSSYDSKVKLVGEEIKKGTTYIGSMFDAECGSTTDCKTESDQHGTNGEM